MFLFLTRWLKGLIIGWIISMVVGIIGRLLKQAMNGPQSPDPLQRRPSSPPPQNNPSHATTTAQPASPYQGQVIDTIWAGMTAEQLRATFGAPHTKHMGQSAEEEVWSYTAVAGMTGETDVTLLRGAVTSWGPRPNPTLTEKM